MLETKKRVQQIIERVSERTNGIIEPCLIDELSRYLEEEDILTFCTENHITIGKEEKRIDKDKKGNVYVNDNIISHSQEMVFWLQIQNENTTKEKRKQVTNELFKIYKPQCDRIARKMRNGRMSQDDAEGEAYLAFIEIVSKNKFRLHDSDSLYGLMVHKIEKRISNAYPDKYVDGVTHHVPAAQRNEKAIQYISYIDECDYETNPHDTAKNNDDIVTEKQTKNGYHDSDIERDAILGVAIDNLPENDRDILLMYLKGITHDEIAKIKGCTRQNITKRIKNITEQLREEVIF